MAYVELLNSVPSELKILFRSLENKSKRLIKFKWSNIFNTMCLREGILPSFSRMSCDPEVADCPQTTEYRKFLVEREISKNKTRIKELENEKDQVTFEIEQFNEFHEQVVIILENLWDILGNSENAYKSRVLKKLSWMYHGKHVHSGNLQFCVTENKDAFLNLSSYNLNQNEIEFLNMGIAYHLEPKYNKLNKKVELEILYQRLLELSSENKIGISPNLSELLSAEGTKHRYIKTKSKLTPTLRKAALDLKNNEDIVIRRADKSATYVILDKEDYLSKLDVILSDTSKFKPISKDPTDKIKKKVNKIIETNNAHVDSFKFSKIVGDYQLAYLYGNIKTHKKDFPVRPIISQVPSATYKLAKTLNALISPYIPGEYSLKNSEEFLDLLNTDKKQGIVASLDVESLFTNLPVDETIDIIISRVYKHPDIPPPKVSSHTLRQLLVTCTKEVPFITPRGDLCTQIGGVAMGSPLGPTFAGFYMGHIEHIVLSDPDVRPLSYGRYVDDIFVQVSNEDQLLALKRAFEQTSVLKFTIEMGVNNRISFLDVFVDGSGPDFKTSVYHKPSIHGVCLNGESECSEKYKRSTITNYLCRAHKISSTWMEFSQEVKCIRQKLINNGYSNGFVDSHIKRFLNNVFENKPKVIKPKLPIYFRGQFHDNYKQDERILKSIIRSNVKSNSDAIVDLRIFYQNPKTKQLVIQNNLNTKARGMSEAGVIYKFTCTLHSQAMEYVGLTQTKLARRLSAHKYHGSIHDHFVQEHCMKPTMQQLSENTSVIAKAADKKHLAIIEALLIIDLKPLINVQLGSFPNVLKLYAPKSGTLNSLEWANRNNTLSPPPPPIPSSFDFRTRCGKFVNFK